METQKQKKKKKHNKKFKSYYVVWKLFENVSVEGKYIRLNRTM